MSVLIISKCSMTTSSSSLKMHFVFLEMMLDGSFPKSEFVDSVGY